MTSSSDSKLDDAPFQQRRGDTGTSAPNSRSDSAPWVEQRTDRRAPLKQRNVPSPNEAARANSYARFIPREELNSFAAWKPVDINGGPVPQPNVQRKPEE